MRFVLDTAPGSFASTAGSARAALDAGFDGVLVKASPEAPAPLVTAAALAGTVEDLLIAAEIPLGDRHPLEVAEEAAVVDLMSSGRLILVVHPAPGAEQRFEEAVRFLLTAFTSRPFRFEGEYWTVPANLPGNVHNIERRARLMPPPRQPRLELWASGVTVALALRYGLGHLADETTPREQLHDEWSACDRQPWAIRLPRAARDTWTSCPELTARLRESRAAFDQDWAVVTAPTDRLTEIGSRVRPRVQLEALPHGLAQHWEGGGSD